MKLFLNERKLNKKKVNILKLCQLSIVAVVIHGHKFRGLKQYEFILQFCSSEDWHGSTRITQGFVSVTALFGGLIFVSFSNSPHSLFHSSLPSSSKPATSHHSEFPSEVTPLLDHSWERFSDYQYLCDQDNPKWFRPIWITQKNLISRAYL